MYRLYPGVKQLAIQNDEFFLKDKFIVFFDFTRVNVLRNLQSFLTVEIGDNEDADIVFLTDDQLVDEGYRLEITTNKIKIYYQSESSAFYATTTLKQLINQSERTLKCCTIEDAPDLRVRGLMMDISRDKVPTLDTIKNIIRLMSDVKMNHLELYVEGFSFGYPSFEKYLEEDGFISVDEYLEIQAFANEHYIDLVPNQNGFGHMTKWLEKEEFKNLAEIEEGIFLWGRWRKANTLNPLDPKSLELIKTMYHDMLPISNSKYFNMNFDEPFELGKGKSKAECEQIGLDNVYIDYALKAYQEIKKYDKIPLIWGDVLIKHPNSLHRLPKDLIFIDWGYDANYPFSNHLQKLSELGIKFIAAPGTTSWCSFLGRTYDWVENITNACVYTKAFNGEGVIVTDWGDFGHLQFLPISYAPIIFSGLMSWRVKEGTFLTLKNYLNKFIFKDEHDLIADTIFDLGNYYRYLHEYRSNGTVTFYNFMWATYASSEDDGVNYYQQRNQALSKEKFHLLEAFFNSKIKEIDLASLHVDDGDVIKAELKQSICLVRLIHKVNYSYNQNISIQERIKILEEVISSKEQFISEQKRLWLIRNKSGGLFSSLAYLEKFFDFANQTLKSLQRGEENEA